LPKLSVSEKFFTVPSGTSAQVLRIMDEIKKRNSRSEFVTKFAATNGYPVWNKVLMGTSQKHYANASLAGNNLDGVTDTTILIPFVMEGEFSVKGFIKATLNDSVSLSYSLAKDYKAYEEKLDNSKTASSAFAMLSMVLNKIVFNEDSYKITNPKILSSDTGHVLTNTINIESFNISFADSGAYRYVILCSNTTFTSTVCGTRDYCKERGGCDATLPCPTGVCYLSTTIQTNCYTIDLPDLGPGGGDGGGGDNGGGGEIPYVYPCQGTQNNCPVPGEGDGWIPWWDEPVNLTQQLGLDIYQSQWLENHTTIAQNIINYLELSNNLQKDVIAREHIIKMINNYEYFTFINFYDNNLNTGMWWENEMWLSNPNNFTLNIENANSQYDELTAEEKALISNLPVQAWEIKQNIETAFTMSQNKFGNYPPFEGLNDKKDAFRHAFFQAINTRDVTPRYAVAPPSPIVITPLSAVQIVTMFANAHESEVPTQLLKEKQMDIHNNTQGINYCQTCTPAITDIIIADAVMQMVTTGTLMYLAPLLLPKYNNLGVEINPNGDPFYHIGPDGTPHSATHGINSNTSIIPTNL